MGRRGGGGATRRRWVRRAARRRRVAVPLARQSASSRSVKVRPWRVRRNRLRRWGAQSVIVTPCVRWCSATSPRPAWPQRAQMTSGLSAPRGSDRGKGSSDGAGCGGAGMRPCCLRSPQRRHTDPCQSSPGWRPNLRQVAVPLSSIDPSSPGGRTPSLARRGRESWDAEEVGPGPVGRDGQASVGQSSRLTAAGSARRTSSANSRAACVTTPNTFAFGAMNGGVNGS